MDKEIMKGSIDLLLLSLIAQRDLYGYEMAGILKNLSKGTYVMSEGTLYSALKRMERKHFIRSYWHETDNGRRKYYHLTDEGNKELETKRENWQWMDALIRKSSEGLT